MTRTELNVAIVGAGPAGLTLARLLFRSSVSSSLNLTIYEKDASPVSRQSIGGTLDLHPPTGLAAIRAMDLWDDFCKYARFEGEEMRMCDQNGTVYVHQIDAPQIKGFEARPEIDRVRLMEILLAGVPENTIRWGKKIKAVIEERSRHQLAFDDGSLEGPFDLIVGADGAWSKVRKVVTDIQPRYSGICSISARIDKESAGNNWESISSMIGKGNNFSFSYERAMMGQRMGDGSIKCGFNSKQDQDWLEKVKVTHSHDGEGLRRVLHEQYKDWVPQFKQWIDASTDFWCANLWELPLGSRFDHKNGVTLIGDAAHLMTPFAGEGVNAAMKDALDLVAALELVLRDGSTGLDTAVQNFEESMFERAAQFTRKTMINKEGMFAKDSPYSFFASMIGVVSKEFGWDLNRGFLYCLPISKLAYGFFWSMGTFGAVRRRLVNLFSRESC